MFISRDIRERKARKSSFWASKWVHLNDGKENHVVPLFTVSLALYDIELSLTVPFLHTL